MEKMKFETPDMTERNIDKIAALFPNCVTEMKDEKGKIKRGINFEMLKQMLSPDVVDGGECYEFTWVGKKAAIVEANRPIHKTLRPCMEESKDWDTTENLYIEGDNLEVLKLLQESYLGKVKMIYIDPPYNTGNDFIYADDFMHSQKEEDEQMGLFDEEGNRLFKNTETNGRFHSDWCSMMYSRLMLARNLLADDGVIFISIDNKEQSNLKKIGDEIFGANNFIEDLVWKKMYGGKIDSKWFAHYHDYILVYARDKNIWRPNLVRRSDDAKARYKNPDNDPRGPWKAADFTGAGSTTTTYPITSPSGKVFYPPRGKHWVASRENYEKLLEEGRLWVGKKGNSRPSIKRFLSEVKEGVPQISIMDHSDVGHSDEASRELNSLMGGKLFDYPKPVKLLHRLVYLGLPKEGIVLDFFSGSATTAHAVMQLNAEDGGKRKFIMVQIQEPCAENSEAFKAGYENICEIGKERIRRAGEKIKSENPTAAQTLDVGFRVLKLDETNMNDVYYSSDEYDQGKLKGLESNIKEDGSDVGRRFGCLLGWGLPLSLPDKSEEIDGCTVHDYNNGDLVACFDKNIPESVVKAIAKRKPLRAVFRDSGFASSPDKINMLEIFKLYMPEDADGIVKRVRVI